MVLFCKAKCIFVVSSLFLFKAKNRSCCTFLTVTLCALFNPFIFLGTVQVSLLLSACS